MNYLYVMKNILTLVGWLLALSLGTFVVVKQGCQKPVPVQSNLIQPALLQEANQKVIEGERQLSLAAAKITSLEDQIRSFEKPAVKIVKVVESVTDSAALIDLRSQYEAQLEVANRDVEFLLGVLAALDTTDYSEELELDRPMNVYDGREIGEGWIHEYEIETSGILGRYWYNTTLVNEDKPAKVRKNWLGVSLKVRQDFESRQTSFPVELIYGRDWYFFSAGRDINLNAYTLGAGARFKF